MRIARHTDMIVNGRPSHSWYEGKDGSHVPLPFDVSAVSDDVVKRVWYAYSVCDGHHGPTKIRAAIAALAQALGEVGDE